MYMDKKASNADKKAKNTATAQVVREARRRCGMNKTQFAAACGVSYQYLAQIENAVHPASAKFMGNVERILSERSIPDAVRSPEEAALLDGYRQLTPESRQAIINAVAALRAALPAPPES